MVMCVGVMVDWRRNILLRQLVDIQYQRNDFDTDIKEIQEAIDKTSEETEEKIPYHYIKYIRDSIFEFRVSYGNICYFCE